MVAQGVYKQFLLRWVDSGKGFSVKTYQSVCFITDTVDVGAPYDVSAHPSNCDSQLIPILHYSYCNNSYVYCMLKLGGSYI